MKGSEPAGPRQKGQFLHISTGQAKESINLAQEEPCRGIASLPGQAPCRPAPITPTTQPDPQPRDQHPGRQMNAAESTRDPYRKLGSQQLSCMSHSPYAAQCLSLPTHRGTALQS